MDKNHEDKVKELAETLRKHGLAVSMYEATEKARNILTAGNEDKKEEKDAEEIPEQDYDITKEKAPLNQLMEEIGVTEEDVKAQETQKLSKIMQAMNHIREEINDSKSDPEKIKQIKDEIMGLNTELDKILQEMDYKKGE